MEDKINQLLKLGFEQIKTNIDAVIFSKTSIGKIKVNGICEPTNTHKTILEDIAWHFNPLIFIENNSNTIILLGSFFILESPEVPLTPLELRDFFDYKIESDLKEKFKSLNLVLGPHWQYIIPTREFEKNIRKGELYLSSPFVGNAINIRSNNIDKLLSDYELIKDFIANQCPLPIIYGVPENIVVGEKDNLYDIKSKTWYYDSIEISSDIAMSVIDLINPTDEVELTQHKYDQDIIESVKMNLKEIWIRFYSVTSKYRSRRKLKKISIVFE